MINKESMDWHAPGHVRHQTILKGSTIMFCIKASCFKRGPTNDLVIKDAQSMRIDDAFLDELEVLGITKKVRLKQG